MKKHSLSLLTALLLALCMLILPVSGSAQDTALPDGCTVSRTEENADFSAEMNALILGLDAAAANAQGGADSTLPDGLTDRISLLLQNAAPTNEGLLKQVVALSLQAAGGAEEECEAIAGDLARMIAVSLPDASADEDGSGEAFVFMLPASAETGDTLFIGTGGADWISLFAVRIDESGVPGIAAQLVFTPQGLMIGQDDAGTGVIRPDGAYAVCAPGKSNMVVLNSRDLSEADRFTLEILSEETCAPADGPLQIAADAAIEDGVLKLQIGDTAQLSVQATPDGRPLSAASESAADISLSSAYRPAEAEGIMREFIKKNLLVPSVQELLNETAALPCRMLKIIE